MQVHPHPGELQHQLRTDQTNPTLRPGGLSFGDSPLTALSALAQGAGPEPRLPATHHKIGRMIESVRANQFVSFVE